MRRHRFGATMAALVSIGMLVSGCGATTVASDQAQPVMDNPWEVAGAASSTGPSGSRPGVPDTDKKADNGDNGKIDKLALNAIADIEEYWQTEYSKTFRGNFKPASKYISWSAKAPESESVQFCKETTYHLVNAAYCRSDNSIGWDREMLLPTMSETFGTMSVVMVLAHEYGHAIQTMAKMVTKKTPVLVKEQQADCFAGAFMRHVAEGKSKHFTINTSDGLNSVLAATVSIRDPDPDDPESVHGSAFERVTAVQIGFTDGPRGLQGHRRGRDRLAPRRPPAASTTERSRRIPRRQGEPDQLARPAGDPAGERSPDLRLRGLTATAPTAVTDPVTYCPAKNTIATDVPGLANAAGHQHRRRAAAGGGHRRLQRGSGVHLPLCPRGAADRKLSLTGADSAPAHGVPVGRGDRETQRAEQ